MLMLILLLKMMRYIDRENRLMVERVESGGETG